MAKQDRSEQRLYLRIQPQDKQHLATLAKFRGENMSEVVIRLIRQEYARISGKDGEG